MTDLQRVERDDITRFLALLDAADRIGAIALAKQMLDRGVPIGAVLEDLVCPAQIEVGSRWQSAAWDIGREHAATSVSEAVIAALALEVAPESHKGSIVVACVEGEWHSLPARVLAEVLRVHGWDVKYLGAATPTPHLIRYLNDEGPDALAISCSVPFNLGGARSVIEASRQSGIPVLAGGRAFGNDARRAEVLGANGWCQKAADAPAVVDGWPIIVTPAPPLVHGGIGEVAPLASMTDALVMEAAASVDAIRPEPGPGAPDASEGVRADLRTMLLFVRSALLCDDPSVVLEYCQWLDSLGADQSLSASAQLDALLGVLPMELEHARRTVSNVRGAL